ncbi:hypothetical protein [Actinoplanes sp. NPDC049265]|uniref:Rv0361 family membrane protein n=1 Tax=Actinoplanes sp. NPDC049265 TaxID=3363902 RepID=UPI00371C8572
MGAGRIVVAVVAVLACGGGGLLIMKAKHDADQEQPPAEAAARSYLDAMLADRLPDAYAMTCTKIHEEMTPKQFEDYQSDRDQIARYEVTGFDSSTSNGKLESAAVHLRMYGHDGRFFDQRLPMTKENGAWRICQ